VFSGDKRRQLLSMGVEELSKGEQDRAASRERCVAPGRKSCSSGVDSAPDDLGGRELDTPTHLPGRWVGDGRSATLRARRDLPTPDQVGNDSSSLSPAHLSIWGERPGDRARTRDRSGGSHRARRATHRLPTPIEAEALFAVASSRASARIASPSSASSSVRVSGGEMRSTFA
jgi:hypothetical protein